MGRQMATLIYALNAHIFVHFQEAAAGVAIINRELSFHTTSGRVHNLIVNSTVEKDPDTEEIICAALIGHQRALQKPAVLAPTLHAGESLIYYAPIKQGGSLL